MKRKSLSDSRLYVIVGPGDAERLSLPVEEIARRAAAGGADIVQLRAKGAGEAETAALARRLQAAAEEHGFLFIVNDSIAAAEASGADGVHLGQDDDAVAQARARLGKGKIIGKSTHSIEQALAAEAEGADYIGFGPVFGTPTKPDYVPVGVEPVREVAARVRVPFFAIGGIDGTNIRVVRSRGATRIAVVRAAVSFPDVTASVRGLKEELLS